MPVVSARCTVRLTEAEIPRKLERWRRIVAEAEEDGEETESFVPVEDEVLAQKLVDNFNTKMADEEKEDE